MELLEVIESQIHLFTILTDRNDFWHSIELFSNFNIEEGLLNKHCTPFKHDIRSASLCGVEFLVTKERREKRAQRESCLKGV